MLGMSRHIDINIGKLCDNACVFCSNGQVPPGERPWADKVKEEIRRAAADAYGRQEP
jgi:2-iminoacetate synthase ThiH